MLHALQNPKMYLLHPGFAPINRATLFFFINENGKSFASFHTKICLFGISRETATIVQPNCPKWPCFQFIICTPVQQNYDHTPKNATQTQLLTISFD